MKNCPEKLQSEDTDTRAVHIVGCEAQWTQPWPRAQPQVDVIHLVRSTGAIVLNPHLHTVNKSCPEKSRPIKNGHHMHSVMLAIVHSLRGPTRFQISFMVVLISNP